MRESNLNRCVKFWARVQEFPGLDRRFGMSVLSAGHHGNKATET